jgi:hypothetical protein
MSPCPLGATAAAAAGVGAGHRSPPGRILINSGSMEVARATMEDRWNLDGWPHILQSS